MPSEASKDDKSPSNTASPSSSSVSEAPHGSESDNAPAVGKPFVLGKNRYTIHGVRFTSHIGRSLLGKFLGKRAAPGATLAIVSYEIENVGQETQTVRTNDFTLVDSEGRTYRPSSDATIALLHESADKDFILSELQPGVPREMTQAFELPQSAIHSTLSLVIPEKGLWASGKAKVALP